MKVVAPTGVAAFNVQGYTIYNLLDIQVKGEFKDLTGDRLLSLQQRFTGVKYIMIDEKSMVGRKLFGKSDRHLRQAFPTNAENLLGNSSAFWWGTLVNFLLLWTCLYTQPYHDLTCLT